MPVKPARPLFAFALAALLLIAAANTSVARAECRLGKECDQSRKTGLPSFAPTPFISISAYEKKANLTLGNNFLYERAPVLRINNREDLAADEGFENRALVLGMKWQF